MTNERTYGNADMIAATALGASLMAMAVGMEGLLAGMGYMDASSAQFWLLPGILGFIIAMMYATGHSSPPGVKA